MAAKQEHVFGIFNERLQKYYGPGGDLVIPEGVSNIDSWAFKDRKTVTSVIIPKGVQEIGEGAFWRCNGLTSVTIPDSVERIGDDAFHGCKSLISVTVPKKVTRIGSHTFYNCNSLTSVTFLGDINSIENLAFKNCYKLKRVTIPHWTYGLKKLLGRSTELFCAKDSILDVPAYYRTNALFGYVSSPKTDMDSDRTKSYLDYTKKNAAKLLPFAFKNRELLQFMCEYNLIPPKDYDAYLTEAEKSSDIGLKAQLLDYMNKLGVETVSIARKNSEKAKDGYEDALSKRIATRDPSKGIEGLTFVISGRLRGWNSVWDSQDEVRKYLESYGAHLSTSVSKQTDYLVEYEENSNSDKIIKAKKYGIPIINKALFNEMIGWRYRDTENIEVPSWIRTIPERAFTLCRSLKTVTIPNSVTSIEYKAFSGCCNLINVKISDSVTSIGSDAFCDTAFFRDESQWEEDVLYLGNHLIKAKETIKGSYEIRPGTCCIGNSAFEKCIWLTSMTIPTEVKSIGNGAFKGCSGLTTVTIPSGVESIESSTFEDCSGLTSMTIPSGVKIIDWWAFEGCCSLKSVVIPDSVKEIGRSAFYKCPDLTIHAAIGSFAEQYAKENKIAFVAV